MAMLSIMENGPSGVSMANASVTADCEGEQDGARVARPTTRTASALTKKAKLATFLHVRRVMNGPSARSLAVLLDLELAQSTESLKRKSAVITLVVKSQNGATGHNVL